MPKPSDRKEPSKVRLKHSEGSGKLKGLRSEIWVGQSLKGPSQQGRQQLQGMGDLGWLCPLRHQVKIQSQCNYIFDFSREARNPDFKY